MDITVAVITPIGLEFVTFKDVVVPHKYVDDDVIVFEHNNGANRGVLHKRAIAYYFQTV